MATRLIRPEDWNSGLTGFYSIEVDSIPFSLQSASKPWTITVPRDNAIRFELRDNEQHIWDATNGNLSERAELASRETFADGVPINVSYSFMLEPGAKNTSYFTVIGQFHQDLGSREPWGPPFAIHLKGEKLAIDVAYSDANGVRQVVKLFEDSFDIVRGKEYKFDITAVFDDQGGGKLMVVRDGVTLADYSGPLGYASQSAVYWAEGIYRHSNATETMAAVYADLNITTGNQVTFPGDKEFIGAPEFEIDSVGAISANGSRAVTVSGSAKPGTQVTLTDGTTVLGRAMVDADGHFTATVQAKSAAHIDLHAIAADASGRQGIPAAPVGIQIGTAAEISAQLLSLATSGVGSIVITDKAMLVVPAGQLHVFLNQGKAALDQIQGSYGFIEQQKFTGLSYDRQDVIYTSEGVVTERLRYAGDKLIFDEKMKADGAREVTSLNSKGGMDVVQYSKDNVALRLDQYDAAGKLAFVQINHSNGAQETLSYDVARGVPVNHTIKNPDGSRVAEELNLTGRNYSTQSYTYDGTGKLVQHLRIEADGTTVWSQVYKADGGREIRNFDGVTGKETSNQIFAADGSRSETKFDVVGKPYAEIVTLYNTAGKIVGTDTFDAAHKLLASDRWNPDGTHTVYLVEALSGKVLGYHLFLANGSFTETLYAPKPGGTVQVPSVDPVRVVATIDKVTGEKTGFVTYAGDASRVESVYAAGTTKVVQTSSFDTSGRLTSIERFDTAGHKLSHEIRTLDGSKELHRYDAATGKELSFVLTKADGARTETTFSIKDRPYDQQVAVYDSASKLVETLRYQNGKVIFDEKVAADGSRDVTSVNAKGGTDVIKYDKSGFMTRLDQYDAAGKLTYVQIKNTNGYQETYTYDVARGLPITHSIKNADGSRLDEDLNITGRAYTKQTFAYDTAGKLVLQQRIEADGTTIWSQVYKANGTREVHNFDGVTGKETSNQIFAADGTRTEAKFGVVGKPYAEIVTLYNAAGKVVGTDTFDSIHRLLTSDRWNADGSHTVFTVEASTGKVLGHTLQLANGTVTTTVYPQVTQPVAKIVDVLDASNQKIGYSAFEADGSRSEAVYAFGTNKVVQKTHFDADGKLLSTEVFNLTGQLLTQTSIKPNGTTETHRFNPATGVEVSSTTVTADGIRTEKAADIGGKSYDKQSAIYDASNKLIEMDRWTDGKLVFSERFDADGTHHVSRLNSNGTTTETVLVQGRVAEINTFDASGHRTLSELRLADGTRELHRYDAASGKELNSTSYLPDKSRIETSYDIKGRDYDQQSAHYDTAGKLIEMTRSSGGHVIFEQVVDKGVNTVHTYDLAGRNTAIQTVFGDGSRDVQTFQFSSDPAAKQPVRVQEDHFAAGNVKLWTDVTTASGTHEQTAYAAGVTLASNAGVKDVFVSAGGDRFVFDDHFGQDVIKRFVTSGANHDVIQIDHDLADSLQDLAISMVGADTVITVSPTDSITLANVHASQLSQSHFLFV